MKRTEYYEKMLNILYLVIKNNSGKSIRARKNTITQNPINIFLEIFKGRHIL